MLLPQLLLIGLLGFCLYPFCSTSTHNQRLHACLTLGTLCAGALLYAPTIHPVFFSGLSFAMMAAGCFPTQTRLLDELKSHTKPMLHTLIGLMLTLLSNTFPSAESLLLVAIAQACVLFSILRHYSMQPCISLGWRKYFVVPYCLTLLAVGLNAHHLVAADDFGSFTQMLFGGLIAACVGLMIYNNVYQRLLQTQLKDLPNVDLGAIQIAYKSRRILKDFKHDLRQPLSTLGILASVGKAISKDPEVGARYFHIQTAQKALKTMLEEFFDELENSVEYPFKDLSLPLKTVQLSSILEPLVDEYRLLAQAKQLELRYFECPVDVFTNTEALTKILRNGLDNAIKYTAEGGVLLGVRTRGESVCIQIVDTGPGIETDPNAQMNKGWGHGSTIIQDLSDQIHAKTACRNRTVHHRVRGSIFEVCLHKNNPSVNPLMLSQEQTSELSVNVLLFAPDNVDPIQSRFPESSFDRVVYNTTNLQDCVRQSLKGAELYPIYIAYTESNLEMELAKQCLELIQALMNHQPCCVLIHPVSESSQNNRIDFGGQMIRLPYKAGQVDSAFKTLTTLFPTRHSSKEPVNTSSKILH